MNRISITVILLQLILLVSCYIPAQAVYLPQSGQTASYATGDDGDIQAGVAWPSPRYLDNGDGTISDNLTGLMWLKDANCFGGQSWVGGLGTVAAFNANPGGYACQDYSAAYSDWRMPNINELATFWTIVPGVMGFPAMIQGLGFTRVQTGDYMSSTMVAGNPFYPWGIYFGGNSYLSTNGGNFLWPVRGLGDGPARVWRTGVNNCYAQYGQQCVCGEPGCPVGQDGELRAGAVWPEPRLVDNQDGTVTDNLTGLMWLKDTNCIATRYPGFDTDDPASDGKVNWQHALDFVAAMNAGTYPLCAMGRHDWRLPNVVEMHSLNDYSQGASSPEPTLPAGHPFSGIDASSLFHTSTSQNASAKIAWYAFGMWVYSPPDQLYQVWPVRYAVSYSTADLAVSQTDSPDPVARSQQITYTVRVKNNGPYHASGVTLSDTLPAGSSFVSATSSQGSCSQTSGVVTCPIGSMDVTTVVNVTIVVTAPSSKGIFSNTASVSSATTDHDNSNNTAISQTTVKAVWYVDGDSPASGSGALWGQAFKTIPEAVSAAAAGDEIWVREGSHTLASQIILNKAVSLYGGFEGNEATLGQRDWKNNPTTINGNGAVPCLKIGVAATVDGLTITNCRNTSASYLEYYGGALQIASSNVNITNCTVSNSSTLNGVGGGIATTTSGLSAITISDSTITGNTATYDGGGIYLIAPNSSVRRCTITGNTGRMGGGIYSEPKIAGPLEISHSVISGNSAVKNGSSGGFGGGITLSGYLDDPKPLSLIISNCLIHDNQAADTGGGVSIYGSNAVIQSSNIVNNRLTNPLGFVQGSAFNFGQANVTVVNSIVWGNQLHTGAYTNQILLQSGGYIIPSYSDIQDSYWGALGNSHDINQDPRFVDASAGNFRLQAISPCIEKGTNTPANPQPATDLAGGPRVLDGDGNGTATIDMGVYEYSDVYPPTGTVSVNGGAPYTNSTSASLTITASDGSLPIQMCISNANGVSCLGSWKALASPEPWTLDSTGGDGIKTVYLWLKDSIGNTTAAPLTDSIILDSTPPSNGTLFLTEGSGAITATWSGFSDGVGSGIASYRLVSSTSGIPVDCSATPLYSGSASSYNHNGLTSGIAQYYRICALDNAGNTSSGATAQGMPGGAAVRIKGPPEVPYGSIQSAYDNAQPNGDTIQARATTFMESVTFNRDINVSLEGGYDHGYGSRSSLTLIRGSLTIGLGVVTVDRLAVW
jgi:uncharacterized repeat protein (TIGR01451 family)